MTQAENKKVAVGYCRVSTDEQVDGISLDYQEERCRKAAHEDGYADVLIIKDEGKTGKNLERKGIQEVIGLAKMREISVVYVTNSDRLARNIQSHTFLRYTLSSNGVTLKYLNGQSSGNDAGSTFADNMFAGVAQYHSDITRDKTKEATSAKARAGYFPAYAPPGYLNCENPDRACEKVARRIIVPHPDYAPLITEAFEMYATGQYSVYELTDIMHKKGLRTKQGRRINPCVFNDVLKNRMYLGEIHWGDIHVKKGRHEPLTDEQTFDRVQSVLFGNGGSRCKRRKYFWLLNGYVFCPVHSRRYTAEWHLDKNIAYYHCPVGKGCSRYIEKSNLEKQVSDKFKELQFSDEFVRLVIEKVKSVMDTRRNEYHSRQRSLLSRKNAHEAKRRVAEDRLMDGTLSKTDYTRIRGEVTAEIDTIQGQLEKLASAKDLDMDVVSEVLSFTKDIYSVYMRSDERLQKKFIGFFFDRFEVRGGVIINTDHSPLFAELVRLNKAFCKMPKLRKALEINVKSEVILTTELGA